MTWEVEINVNITIWQTIENVNTFFILILKVLRVWIIKLWTLLFSDILQMAKDLPTFLFVISAVAILSMLLCLVLKLFVGKSNIRERSVITTRLLSSSELGE